MRQYRFIFLLISFFSCQIGIGSPYNHYIVSNKFQDSSKYLLSVVKRIDFDTLHESDFVWLVYRPLNEKLGYQEEAIIEKKLSSNLKMLRYICKFDNGCNNDLGFANFYYNYATFEDKIKNTLNLLNDTAMLSILNEANRIYTKRKIEILKNYKNSNWNPILKMFQSVNTSFLIKYEHMMGLMEKYIRRHQDDFIQFSD